MFNNKKIWPLKPSAWMTKGITGMTVGVAIALICLMINISFANEKTEMVRVYISQGAKHPALDATTAGVVAGLKEAGYNDSNMDLQIEYAQGNIVLAKQIASKFVSKNPDIIVGIATMASQSFMKYVKEKKASLIFTTVTDPIGANLTINLDGSGETVSGVSNYIPLEPQLKMFKKIKPDIKTLGFLYNQSESNSISLIKKLEEACPKFSIKLVTQVANQASDVMQATTKLASEVDAIFISTDATALSSISVIIKAAKLTKTPVFVGDTDLVKDGAIAALGPNQYEVGKQTGAMIVRVLKGEDIASMPVEFPKINELYLNTKAAKEFGIVIPKELIDKADRVIE